MKIDVHKVAMAAPNDVSGLQSLICTGVVDPATIVAVIGKTEGNGGANDFTRGYATLSFQLLLGPLLGLTPEQVGARIAFVWSGGTEGVLSPTRPSLPAAHPARRSPTPALDSPLASVSHATLSPKRSGAWPWWKRWRRRFAIAWIRPASPIRRPLITSR